MLLPRAMDIRRVSYKKKSHVIAPQRNATVECAEIQYPLFLDLLRRGSQPPRLKNAKKQKYKQEDDVRREQTYGL